jgi:hypothetical protein
MWSTHLAKGDYITLQILAMALTRQHVNFRLKMVTITCQCPFAEADDQAAILNTLILNNLLESLDIPRATAQSECIDGTIVAECAKSCNFPTIGLLF